MRFEVKQNENEYIGIDLKSVSLKRKITNEESSVVSLPEIVFFANKFLIRYNTYASARGVLYKLENCEVELYHVLQI